MQANLTRKTLVAGAIAAALSLAACGDNNNDAANTSSVDRPATTSSATTSTATTGASTTDRMTADAGAAVDRAESRAGQAGDRAASNVGDAANDGTKAASDAVMTAKVKARLMAEPGIDSLDIDVDTDNGRVILTGEVDTPQNRARAKELAGSIEGVRGVVDRLTMRQG